MVDGFNFLNRRRNVHGIAFRQRLIRFVVLVLSRYRLVDGNGSMQDNVIHFLRIGSNVFREYVFIIRSTRFIADERQFGVFGVGAQIRRDDIRNDGVGTVVHVPIQIIRIISARNQGVESTTYFFGIVVSFGQSFWVIRLRTVGVRQNVITLIQFIGRESAVAVRNDGQFGEIFQITVGDFSSFAVGDDVIYFQSIFNQIRDIRWEFDVRKFFVRIVSEFENFRPEFLVV